jgi:hypothetical protein
MSNITEQKKFFALFITLVLTASFLFPAKIVHAASANAFLSPTGIGVYKNNTLTVGVYENSGTDTVNGASLFINFPTLYFKVSKSDIRSSAAFNVDAATNINGGQIQIDRGAINPLSGTQLVATIDFHAVASGVAIPITFDTTSTNIITSSVDSSNIYSGGTGANYALYDPIATGKYMVINSGGGAFSSTYLNNGLTQETALGDAKEIAVGGNNMMVITSCGAAFASNTPGGHWTQKTTCGDAKAIAVGNDGTMMIINSCGAAFSAPNLSAGWTQRTACGDAKAISVGGKNTALITGNNTAYASTSWGGPWSQLTGAGDAQDIAISSGGIVMLKTGCGAAYASHSFGGDGWSQKAVCGDAMSIAAGGSKVGLIASGGTAFVASAWNSGMTRVSNVGDARALSLGDTTPVMMITACGAAFGNLGIGIDGYNQITICGDTKKIAG